MYACPSLCYRLHHFLIVGTSRRTSTTRSARPSKSRRGWSSRRRFQRPSAHRHGTHPVRARRRRGRVPPRHRSRCRCPVFDGRMRHDSRRDERNSTSRRRQRQQRRPCLLEADSGPLLRPQMLRRMDHRQPPLLLAVPRQSECSRPCTRRCHTDSSGRTHRAASPPEHCRTSLHVTAALATVKADAAKGMTAAKPPVLRSPVQPP